MHDDPGGERGSRPSRWKRLGLVLAILLLSTFELAAGVYNPFIYFRF